MAEQEAPVEVIGIKYICDECGKGQMLQVGALHIKDNVVQFPHTCTHCNHQQDLPEKYPLVRFKIPNGDNDAGNNT